MFGAFRIFDNDVVAPQDFIDFFASRDPWKAEPAAEVPADLLAPPNEQAKEWDGYLVRYFRTQIAILVRDYGAEAERVIRILRGDAAGDTGLSISDSRGSSWSATLQNEWAVKPTFAALWPYLGGYARGQRDAKEKPYREGDRHGI